MGQRFSAHSIAPTGERRELRLLTTPLYRYESADPAVIDGALFAFVCNVGTDPEIFLLLEAREEPGGPRWQFALARFGSRDLFVNEGDREVWRAVRGVEDTINYNPDRTYWLTGEANVAPP
ncbi:MAG TPA: hypothetical protein VFW87_25605 [Pirellulales bacterium]|nr:hypothetical protein [Pirellulales bacterium]